MEDYTNQIVSSGFPLSPEEQVQPPQNLWQSFKQNFDPFAALGGFVQEAYVPGSNMGSAISMGLLAGRQARVGQALDAAERAAAGRKEKMEMARQGLYETPEGFGKRSFMNTSTGAVLQQDVSPQGQMKISPIYTPPARPDQDKPKYKPVQVMDQNGKPVTLMVNENDPSDSYPLGGVVPRNPPGRPSGGGGGGAGGGGDDIYSGRTQTTMDEVASYFPITDQEGRPVDWRNYDPNAGHTVDEKVWSATGQRMGNLPTWMQGSGASDLVASLGQLKGTTFLSELVASKQRGATFGALSNEEKKAIEEAATVAGDPTITPDKRIRAMQRLDMEITKAVANHDWGDSAQPRQSRTSTGVSWSPVK